MNKPSNRAYFKDNDKLASRMRARVTSLNIQIENFSLKPNVKTQMIHSTISIERSMFLHRRHHNPGWWPRDDRNGVHVVARALARLLYAESRRSEWREPAWQRRQQRRPTWTHEQRRFDAWSPRGPPRRTPAPGRWLPHPQGDPRPRRDWQLQFPEQRPRRWRGSTRPRRGPPVAAIRVPRWRQREEREERRPSENVSRGPLR